MKNDEKRLHVREYTVYEKKRWEEKKKLNKENMTKD